MDIYEAIKKIEAFSETYPDAYSGVGKWAPTETKIVPSGDDADHIKIWFNLGEGLDGDQVEAMRKQFLHDLHQAHPEVEDFTLEVRVEAF